MNVVMLCGRICSIPKCSIISIDGKQTFVCKVTVGIETGEYSLEGKMVDKTYDFFETITFGNPAEYVSKHFSKGSKIVLFGELKNFKYIDGNGTAHFTTIILANSIEFGDTESAISNILTKKSNVDVTIRTDIKFMEEMFDAACEQGYLCIEENDYYKIATGNMEI